MNAKRYLVKAALAALTLGLIHAQGVDANALSLEGAKNAIAAAAAEAKRLNAPGGAFAVVDEGGNLIAEDPSSRDGTLRTA
jgi:hypothetical protein